MELVLIAELQQVCRPACTTSQHGISLLCSSPVIHNTSAGAWNNKQMQNKVPCLSHRHCVRSTPHDMIPSAQHNASVAAAVAHQSTVHSGLIATSEKPFHPSDSALSTSGPQTAAPPRLKCPRSSCIHDRAGIACASFCGATLNSQ